MVATLGVTAIASYGTLTYAFAVFIVPMSVELGWSKATLTGAYSLGQLVTGVSAIPVGRWIDRNGARGLMVIGAVVGTLLLIAWAYVESVIAFYVLWALIGVVSAAVLYEPAFAVIATWFRRNRSRALTLLTFIGGFASVIFVPLTALLVEQYGWRSALLRLAAIYACLTILPLALVLRHRPRDVGFEPDGLRPDRDASSGPSVDHVDHERSAEAHEAIRSHAFRWLTISFALSAITITSVAVHFVPLLRERGFNPTFAGAAMGVLGLMVLPGRLLFAPLGARWAGVRVTGTVLWLGAVAILVLLLGRGQSAVWAFVVLFGVGFGVLAPARAGLVADAFGPARYGEINGVLSFVLSLARAIAPLGTSLLYDVSGSGAVRGYDVVLVAWLVLTLGSAAAVGVAGRGMVRHGDRSLRSG